MEQNIKTINKVLEGAVHTKLKIFGSYLLTFIVVPNMYDVLSSVEHFFNVSMFFRDDIYSKSPSEIPKENQGELAYPVDLQINAWIGIFICSISVWTKAL